MPSPSTTSLNALRTHSSPTKVAAMSSPVCLSINGVKVRKILFLPGDLTGPNACIVRRGALRLGRARWAQRGDPAPRERPGTGGADEGCRRRVRQIHLLPHLLVSVPAGPTRWRRRLLNLARQEPVWTCEPPPPQQTSPASKLASTL